jgi:hypothetical protein
MKRRKFIQNMLLAAAGTVIPVALLAGKKPVLCEHEFNLWTNTCEKCGITAERLENLKNTVILQTRIHKDDLYASLMQEPHPWYTVRELEDRFNQI